MIDPNQGNVAEGNKGYRRGVIFGLTMAEILLLLLFCLLLAFKWIYDEREKFRKENEDLKANQTELSQRWKEALSKLKIYEDEKPEEDKSEEEKEFQELALAILTNIEILNQKDPKKAKEIADELKSDPDTLSTSTIIDIETFEKLTTAQQFVEMMMSSNLYPVLSDKPLEDLNLLHERLMVLTEAERTSPEVFASAENIKDFLTALKTKDKDSKGPPIINLPEAEEFSFKSGQAVLSQAFSQRLRTDILEKILINLKEYDADIIEVIGHTDEVAVGNKREKTSTLDTNVINFILGQTSRTPTAIDNAGLGLARASAVTRVLRTIPELKKFEILPYSAGQLVLPDETLTTGESVLADDERRRIEIRVRRRMRD